jgi:hypothetical protein
MKIAACESPFERLRRSLISALESHQRQLQRSQILEIHGCQQLTLNNGEIDLDLVSQLAWIGVRTRMTLGHLALRRTAARAPRWDEPLSAMKYTRCAER